MARINVNNIMADWREMIVAQQMAGGAPAQEMSATVFSKNS